MTRYVALLRAVNVGGTGKLAMAELRAMAEAAGFARVETYIASGNVVFESNLAPAQVQAALEARLRAHAGKPVGVTIRQAAELTAVLAANPFPDADPKHAYVFFLDQPAPEAALTGVSGQQDERVSCGKREIYVHYPAGMGRSKLKIPAAKTATARNLNTVAKLAEMAAKP